MQTFRPDFRVLRKSEIAYRRYQPGGHELVDQDALHVRRGMAATNHVRVHEARLEGHKCRFQGRNVSESDRVTGHVRLSICGLEFGTDRAYWPILSKAVAALIMSSTLG